MKKLILYIATSLDGKIAKPDGDVAWLDQLPNPDKSDYGYADFYNTLDTTLMGRKTYDQVLGFDLKEPLYPKTKNYVFTTQKDNPVEGFEFVNEDPVTFTKKLKQQEGKDVWLIGGAAINTPLFNAGLIDEMMVFVMPIVLGDGIPLFARSPNTNEIQLIDNKVYEGGAALLHYAVR